MKKLFIVCCLIITLLAIGCRKPPVDELTFNPSSPTTGQSIRMTVPNGGTNATYYWDFGDGRTSNTQANSTSHSYSATGTFNVSVDVHQSSGVASYSGSIVVY